MASSPIRINEATIEELQQLHGIGPKRAAYIVEYRRRVSPILSDIDLAAATGMSRRAVEQLALQIDWHAPGTKQRHSTWPVLLVAGATLALILAGLRQLLAEPVSSPAGQYNLAVALVQTGILAAAADIIISVMRGRPSETSGIFLAAVMLTAAGLISLITLWLLHFVLEAYAPLGRPLQTALEFLFLAMLAAWLIYGPSILLGFSFDDDAAIQPGIAPQLYYASLFGVSLTSSLFAVWNPSRTLLEEVFAVGSMAVIYVCVSELVRGRSAFLSMLRTRDQERLKFTWRRRFGEFEERNHRRTGWLLSALLVLQLICLLSAMLQ